MVWITSAANFLLSEWLWSVTWGWYHVPVNIFMMICLLKLFGRMRIVPSIIISVLCQFFSFLLLTLVVFLVPIYLLNVQFVSHDCYANEIFNPLFICLFLGAIYFVLHVLFFALTNLAYTINMRLVVLIAFVANVLSALLCYKFWSYDFF